ncbi:TPA: hypothetical protein QCR92_005770, partial [Bacillus anthracis]|nr:hypothetical protein [Bacillus anthracis]
DLSSELLDINFDGATCCIVNQNLQGEFKIKRVYFEDMGEGYNYCGTNLVIDIGSGEFRINENTPICKMTDDKLYKWGYEINIGNENSNLIDQCTIVIGKKYTNHELLELEEKEFA